MRLRWACVHVCVCARVCTGTLTLAWTWGFFAPSSDSWLGLYRDGLGHMETSTTCTNWLCVRVRQKGVRAAWCGHTCPGRAGGPEAGVGAGSPRPQPRPPACPRLTVPAPALTRMSYVGRRRFCLTRISVLNFVRDVSPRSQRDAHS